MASAIKLTRCRQSRGCIRPLQVRNCRRESPISHLSSFGDCAENFAAMLILCLSPHCLMDSCLPSQAP